ncbi:hypothetical protein FOMPIDRAFT_1087130, partial [Fomitopsis schrenkii]
IQRYLEDVELPKDLSEKQVKRFVRKASDFFIRGGRLWRRGSGGNAKRVIMDLEWRLSLLKEAHNDLGHKGVYSVRVRLLEHFWWPYLEYDVKWYMSTCYDCQV